MKEAFDLAEVMKCDICGKIGTKEHTHQVGFNLEDKVAFVLGRISSFKNVAKDTRDLCDACYSDLLGHFTDNPISDPNKCEHGEDWDDCPDCRH